jgi:hypothetical protein
MCVCVCVVASVFYVCECVFVCMQLADANAEIDRLRTEVNQVSIANHLYVFIMCVCTLLNCMCAHTPHTHTCTD